MANALMFIVGYRKEYRQTEHRTKRGNTNNVKVMSMLMFRMAPKRAMRHYNRFSLSNAKDEVLANVVQQFS